AWSTLFFHVEDRLHLAEEQVVRRGAGAGEHQALAQQAAVEQLDQGRVLRRRRGADVVPQGDVPLLDIGGAVAEDRRHFLEVLFLGPAPVVHLVDQEAGNGGNGVALPVGEVFRGGQAVDFQ